METGPIEEPAEPDVENTPMEDATATAELGDVAVREEELFGEVTPPKLLRSNAFCEELTDGGADTPASNATTLVMGETPKAG